MDSKERLIDRLKEIKLLKNRSAETALRSLQRGAFLPPGLGPMGDCDVPVPCSMNEIERTVPSLKLMALLLEALELSENHRVAVIDSKGGYAAAAVATALGGRGKVTAVELDLREEETVLPNLEKAGLGDMIDVMSYYAFNEKSSLFDRILLLTDELSPRKTVSKLADLGFVLSRGGPEGLALKRTVKSGEDVLEILFGDVRLIGPMAGPRGHEAFSDIDVSKVLGLEDILSNVWSGRFLTEKEVTVAEIVKETFAGGSLDITQRAKLEDAKIVAHKAFHMAYLYQSMGYFEDAEDLYKASISIHPSAESHTFLGWNLSFDGRYEDAIAECKKAIDIDPDLGNPYNDIGAYLIELGRLDEATLWLKKALDAERYCCYCYAHCNLGRVYLMQGKRELARKELERALDLNPDYELARELLNRLCGDFDYFA